MANYLIPLEEFKKEELEKTIVLEPEQFSEFQSEGIDVTAPVQLKIKLLKFGQDYNIRGQITTRVSVECSRCLNAFEIAVSEKFNNIYAQDLEPEDDTELEIQQDDLERSTVTGEFIDIIELVHEQLVLQLPLKPLCRLDCRGLCPQCGQDLNLKQCHCPATTDDPRFSVLKSLLDQSSNDEIKK